MSSEIGRKLRVSVFGQSHGRAIGAVVDGLPAGEPIDTDALAAFMDRRRPGKNRLSTARSEADAPVFLSGIEGGVTCGAPICLMIENGDTRSRDYSELADKPRPGHADYTAHVKYGGHADMRGGGHFSGRLTAPLCAAGGMALQILGRRGIYIGAHLASVGTERDAAFPLHPGKELFDELAARELPVIDEGAGERMRQVIVEAAGRGDSVGGVIECAAIGLPAGLGDPMFDGVENRLGAGLFGIPGVKGVEFGAGFRAAEMYGSENNDAYYMSANGDILTRTNNSGGILGGITDGMPLLFRAALKPTPSISMEQETVSLSRMEGARLAVRGRHDPCIAHRAVPVIEAVAAIVLLDMILDTAREELKWI